MPRNLKGGNKAKKGANKNLIPKAIIEADEGQYYGIVTNYFGSGRCELTYIYTDLKVNNIEIDCQEIKVKGILRGSLRKKVRLGNGDIILITPRDYQSDVVDIINKYSNDDIQKLRKQKIAHPNLFKVMDNVLNSKVSTSVKKDEDEMTFGYDEEDEFDIHADYEEQKHRKKKSYDTYAAIYNDMPSYEDEDEDDVSD
jgi:initiation factor 1A